MATTSLDTSPGRRSQIQVGQRWKTLALKTHRGLALFGAMFDLPGQWSGVTQGLAINNVSLVAADRDQVLYRLGLAPSRDHAPGTDDAIRDARFDGVETTGPALYLDAMSGQAWPAGDRELAMQYAQRHTGIDRDHISRMALVTRFGPGYDFRNKRLPVWRVDYGAPHNTSYFIDTTTGVLADEVEQNQRPEQISFSLLHKWNFLRPLGRNGQNGVIFGALVLAFVFMAGIGIQMDLKRRKRRPLKVSPRE